KQLLAREIEERSKPFLDELKKRGMENEAANITEWIRKVATENMNTVSHMLYLLLQNKMFNEIEDEQGEPAEALMFLFNLMRDAWTLNVRLEMLVEELKK
ncbi:MAG: hypothetical protein CO040_05145, partial [Candidatus Pacebacteria bacterium CG_4_9_14_0_2_um_filter_36_8]